MSSTAKYPYFTPNQVALHNSPDDCWLSWLGCVYNLSDITIKFSGDPMLNPILSNAGQDISHWFDKKTGTVLIINIVKNSNQLLN
jgi:cytochrome b involved in lipid metabolism